MNFPTDPTRRPPSESVLPAQVAQVAQDSLLSTLVCLGARAYPALAERARLNELYPHGEWDHTTGVVTLELAPFRRIRQALQAAGQAADELWLEVEGERKVPLNLSILDPGREKCPATFDAGTRFRQTDVRLVFARAGRVVFASEPRLFEDLSFPRVLPASLAGDPLPGAEFPGWLREKAGMPSVPDLIRLAAQAQQEIIQVVVHPDCADPRLAELFRERGARLQIEPQYTAPPRGNGQTAAAATSLSGWRVTDPATGETLTARAEDLWHFANAAFNSHVFRWDGDASNLALRFARPELARNWPRFLIDLQGRRGSGLIPRETRAANLTPFQHEYRIKLGALGSEKRPNGEIFNPPLTGLCVRGLYRWDPDSFDRDQLRAVADCLRHERHWLERTHAVRPESNGGNDIAGFTWTNLGSGRDNAPRPLGQPGCLAVDLISYYKMMIDQEAEFRATLGEWEETGRLRERAQAIGGTIEREYWDENLGLYVDLWLRPDGELEKCPVRTLAGFWPLLARSPRSESVV